MSQSSAAAAPAPTRARNLLTLGSWGLSSFAPLILFWLALRIFGLVVAVLVGSAASIGVVVFEVVRSGKVSLFTIYSCVCVFLFGGLDLYYRSTIFVQLEPALGNFLTSGFFAASVFAGRPIIVEFAEKGLGRPVASEDGRRYLRALTWVWVAFLALRGAAFVWVAFHLSVERGLLFRATLGPASFGGLIAAEMLYRRFRFPKR